jgi:hypothetical protein
MGEVSLKTRSGFETGTGREQTKTLFRAAVVSNAASVLAVGGLAFGAARLA